MPEKLVALPDGRIVAFPDSMDDAAITAAIEQEIGGQKSAEPSPGGKASKRGYVGTGYGGAAIVDDPAGYAREQNEAHLRNAPMYGAMLATGGAAAGPLTWQTIGEMALQAAAGGGLGSLAKQVGRGDRPTLGETARDMAWEGGTQGLTMGAGKALASVANPLFRFASGASTAAADLGLRKGLMVTSGNAAKLRDAIAAARAAGRTPTAATGELADAMTRATASTPSGGLTPLAILGALLEGPSGGLKGAAAGLAIKAARSPAVRSGAALAADRTGPLISRAGPNTARILEMLLSGDGDGR